MGPVQQADSNDGAMDGVAKDGDDMYDEKSDNMAGAPVQEFVQVVDCKVIMSGLTGFAQKSGKTLSCCTSLES